jgi:hypothetical protein
MFFFAFFSVKNDMKSLCKKYGYQFGFSIVASVYIDVSFFKVEITFFFYKLLFIFQYLIYGFSTVINIVV